MFVQTARLFCSASAALAMVFFVIIIVVGSATCTLWLTTSATLAVIFFMLRIIFYSATSTVRMTASATTCCWFFDFSATCTGLRASTAAAGMRSRQRNAAGTDQTGNAQAGKQFLQILAFHNNLLGMK